MGFASTYLVERTLFPQIIEEAPDKDTGIIVVVPAYNENGIINLLDSLSLCQQPVCSVEVIIVINAPDNASSECLANNLKSFNEIISWRKQKKCFFRLYSFMVPEHSISGWGVGLARKTGMDEAVRRFNEINKPDGVILNLDADCTVAPNYFEAVEEDLFRRPEHKACSIYFEHPVDGNNFPPATLRNITLYELHLRYYYQALAYSDFPYVFHTVGSAIAVKALPYIKAGGMNRRQAGEDFYFVQKLVPSGGYFNLNTTTVYPSPRVSDRVPFGTGASMGKLSNEQSPVLLTYNINAFTELKSFFSLTKEIFSCREDDLHSLYQKSPGGIKLFLDEKECIEKMTEVRNNTSGLSSFTKRFYEWFNMFKIVKYLNFVHTRCFDKIPVEVAAAELISRTGKEFKSDDPLKLLRHYRYMEKCIIYDGK